MVAVVVGEMSGKAPNWKGNAEMEDSRGGGSLDDVVAWTNAGWRRGVGGAPVVGGPRVGSD